MAGRGRAAFNRGRRWHQFADERRRGERKELEKREGTLELNSRTLVLANSHMRCIYIFKMCQKEAAEARTSVTLPVLGFDGKQTKKNNNEKVKTRESSKVVFFFFLFCGPSFTMCHFILSFSIRERRSVFQHCMENYSSSSADVWISAVHHSAVPENLRVRPTIVFPSREQIGAGADKFLQSHFDVGCSPIVLFSYFILNKSQMSAH